MGQNLGEAALRVALNEIGNGEEGRNNHGFHLKRYRRGRPPYGSGAWCATFISYCLEEGWCGLGKKMKHFPITRSNSAAKLAMSCQKYGKLIDFHDMKPGDILLFDRRGGKHINIVHETVWHEERGIEHFTTIDGNKGVFPAEVKFIDHSIYPRPLKVIRLP